jgi:dTDP-glucose 4,6-dehydratase
MKLLVTGGAGFIGSNFIRYMLSKHPDYEIINLDKLTYAGNLENLRDIEDDPRYSFIKGDICDAALMDELAPRVDTIVNFAAESHVDRSIGDPRPFVVTDILGTQTILEAVKKHKVGRFLHISTDEVYGSIDKGSFRETDPLLPNSPYAASKAGADLLCRSFFKTYGTPVLVTRSSNNFGPYQHPEKLIPYLSINTINREAVQLYGDGTNIRDWIYVLDNCRAIDTVLDSGLDGEIYNISAGNETRNIDIAKSVCGLNGLSEDVIGFVTDRPGHDFRYSVNSAKTHALGWAPEADFITSLQDTVSWYRDNETWWRPLKDSDK